VDAEARSVILKEFELFRGNGPGIECWISEDTPDLVFQRLAKAEMEPISLAQLNQLLILSHEAGISSGFFKYYWLSGSALAKIHPYNVTRIPEYNPTYENLDHISSLPHLKWGLYRLYVDALLYFGNVRQAYRVLRDKTYQDLEKFFCEFRFDTHRLTSRGAPIIMDSIAKDDRYLIAEIACKTYDPESSEPLAELLIREFHARQAAGARRVTFRELITPTKAAAPNPRQGELEFSITEVLDTPVASEEDIVARIQPIADRFMAARQKALTNTNLYISMIDDLDVYVATSMRSREHFREMAEFCENIFSNNKLRDFSLRYFDPTLSAASGQVRKRVPTRQSGTTLDLRPGLNVFDVNTLAEEFRVQQEPLVHCRNHAKFIERRAVRLSGLQKEELDDPILCEKEGNPVARAAIPTKCELPPGQLKYVRPPVERKRGGVPDQVSIR
jgi:hypothetical protein